MKPSSVIADEIRNAECPMSDRLAKALEAVEQLEQQRDEWRDKFAEADSLAKLALHLNNEFTKQMDECKERFTHKGGCMRRLPYRKSHWPCNCDVIEAISGRAKEDQNDTPG